MSNSRHKGPRRDETSAAAIGTTERHAEWFEARKAGKTYREIAEQFGVHHSTVQEAIGRRLRDTIAEPANELRELELTRLDALLAAVWPAAMLGDPDAHAAALKAMAARHKLLGLEAPTKLQHTFADLSDEELQAKLAAVGVKVEIGEKT